MGEVLRTSRDGPVATVTMARAEVHNAFNEQLIAALDDAFTSLGNHPDVRVIVVAGEGKSFSVGADLDWMRRMGDASDEANIEDARKLAAMLRTVADCSKPVVARVHGTALGGGTGLTAAADVAVAAESAEFGFSEVRVGLAPATIAPHVMERIGPGPARTYFLTGERFSAQRALEIGLVSEVVPDADVDAAVQRRVDALLAGSPAAQTRIKKLVREVSESPRDEIDGYTAEVIAGLRTSEEGREGVLAFLEKRKPKWVVDS
jgi:methylglutaconyl-CoA hydratase